MTARRVTPEESRTAVEGGRSVERNGHRTAAPRKAAAESRKEPPARTGRSRSGSSGWSPAELAEVRQRLQAELGTLNGEYQRSVTELEDMQSRGPGGSGDDQADAGSATFEREQELSIVANRRDLIEQMVRAIARVDAGAYGLCERCGKPIPKARLQAFPAATLDVDCKAREERR